MAVFWDSDPDSLPDSPGTGLRSVWDICTLSSIELPGLCYPIVSPKRQIDRRKGKARNHGSIFDLGHELTPFQLKHEIYNDQQWAEWERIKKNLDPTEINDDEKRYFSIYHPSLTDCNVFEVYLNERSNWQSKGSEKGGIKECVWQGYVVRKPKDSGPEKAGPGKQGKGPNLGLPGNVFENVAQPIAPSAQGIYPADER